MMNTIDNTNYSHAVTLTLPVGGDGLWLSPNSPKGIEIVGFNWCDMISIIEDEDGGYDEYGGEIDLYFDPSKWDTKKMGLVYTDDGFLNALRAWFTEQGIARADTLEYTESGMQGDNYISLEAGREFAVSLIAKVW